MSLQDAWRQARAHSWVPGVDLVPLPQFEGGRLVGLVAPDFASMHFPNMDPVVSACAGIVLARSGEVTRVEADLERFPEAREWVATAYPGNEPLFDLTDRIVEWLEPHWADGESVDLPAPPPALVAEIGALLPSAALGPLYDSLTGGFWSRFVDGAGA